MRSRSNYLILLAGVIAISSFTGCRFHEWVELSSQRYMTAFNTDFGGYKGVRVALLNVTNVNQNIDGYTFKSTDQYFSYYVQNDRSLMAFLGGSLAKALQSAGMRVTNRASISTKLPCLQFSIRSISEVSLELGLKVFVKGRREFEHAFSTDMAQLQWDQRAAPGGSERRTYKMISKLVEQILNDRRIVALLLGPGASSTGGSPTPHPPPASKGQPHDGCTKDTECKGNRICENWECVTP